MPELSIKITGVESSMRSMTPLLHFKVRIDNSPRDENIQAVVLNAQIQIQSPQREYSAAEKENLFELFGPPESWGETLRNRLWAHTNAMIGPFRGSTEVLLPVPCTFDLNIASAKPMTISAKGNIMTYHGAGGELRNANPRFLKRLEGQKLVARLCNTRRRLDEVLDMGMLCCTPAQ